MTGRNGTGKTGARASVNAAAGLPVGGDTGAVKRRITLAQVAKRAGVSRTAASFAISGRTDQRLARDTIAKVKKAAFELGYRPNLTAKTLRTGKSGTVGLISDFISSTSVANAMISGVIDELRKHELLLFTVDTQGDRDLEKVLIHALLDRQVDGIIYASMFTRMVSAPDMPGIPLTLLNCLDAGSAAPSVVPDEVGAGRAAARALLDAGHREGIAFLGDFPNGVHGGPRWRDLEPLAFTERLEGITEELSTAGVRLKTRIAVGDWTIVAGRAATTRMLETAGADRPTALICINDEVALGAYQALHSAGLRVPDDVSLASFDGSRWIEAVDPHLSSVRIPQQELGRTAAQMLIDCLAHPEQNGQVFPNQQSAAKSRVVSLPMALTGTGTIAPPSAEASMELS